MRPNLIVVEVIRVDNHLITQQAVEAPAGMAGGSSKTHIKLYPARVRKSSLPATANAGSLAALSPTTAAVTVLQIP